MVNQAKRIKSYFHQLDRSFYMDKHKELSGMDRPAAIGHGQTISQPSLVLKMTLALDLQPESGVLEIGTGSGFQTALLAAFSEAVYTVERIEPLFHRAKERLEEAGFSNVRCKLGNGSEGWAEFAPYDRIMVTAAAAKVPVRLIEQLAAGGKMLIPVGGPGGQELTLIEKDEAGEISSSVIEHVIFVRLQENED